MNALLSPLRLLWQHRALLRQAMRNDVRARYAGSALGLGVGSVTSNATLIKNTLFPIELIPVKSVLASRCTQVAGGGSLLIVVLLLVKLPTWSLMLPAVWVLLALAAATFFVGYWFFCRLKAVFAGNV